MENPHTWQYALSFDQQIGDDFAIGAQLVYKDSQDGIGWYISDDGYCAPFQWDDPYTPETDSIELCEIYVQPTLRRGNGPGPGSLAPDATYHLNYKGGILTFRKRYADHWDLMASYTYSKTEGVNPRPHENGSLGQGTAVVQRRHRIRPQRLGTTPSTSCRATAPTCSGSSPTSTSGGVCG